jgi:hypothetical protein
MQLLQLDSSNSPQVSSGLQDDSVLKFKRKNISRVKTKQLADTLSLQLSSGPSIRSTQPKSILPTFGSNDYSSDVIIESDGTQPSLALLRDI